MCCSSAATASQTWWLRLTWRQRWVTLRRQNGCLLWPGSAGGPTMCRSWSCRRMLRGRCHSRSCCLRRSRPGAGLVLLVAWLWPKSSSPSPAAAGQTSTALVTQSTAGTESGTPGTAAPQTTGPATSTLAATRPSSGAPPPPNKTPAPSRPAGTVAPVLPYPAPALSVPEDNAEFRGRETPIHLQWRAVGALAASDAYVVTIAFPHDGAIWHDSQLTAATEVRGPALCL